MTSPFHAGELAVQERAGTRQNAARIGKGIGNAMPEPFQHFLATQRFAVLGSIDRDGRVWASLLTGRPSFIQALDERTVRIGAVPSAGDPLIANLGFRDDAGMLVIEPATRRRVRLNGHAELLPEGGLLLRVAEVFGNCQKYIQARDWGEGANEATPPHAQQTNSLTASQREWIARADTCFIASAHPDGGVDASHRGGQPGFGAVLDERRLVLPDYAGNTMFQTLGNLAGNPHAGLLFVDFENGSTLQLTGRAEIIWDAERIAAYVGAERLVEFTVDQVIEVAGATPLRGHLREYSSFNPTEPRERG
jgi:uncharacterized protein